MPCHVWYISCSFTNPTILVDLFSPTKIHSMRKFLTTPFPFPLVQMARTFLFFCTFPTSACALFCLDKCDSVMLLTHSLVQFWQDVFTVPFALLSDTSSVYAHCVTIFILTYGFMGLEYVSIELDNPFGTDDNDFDNLGMAYVRTQQKSMSLLVFLALQCSFFCWMYPYAHSNLCLSTDCVWRYLFDNSQYWWPWMDR